METEQHQFYYAGFWARAAAYFLDGGITTFISVQMYTMFREQMYYSYDFFESHSGRYVRFYVIVFGLIFNWFYFAGFESSYLQATPGKWLLGIRVTDLQNKRITFGQATGRHFAKIVSALILCIGYMMAGFTERRQALHDMMAECLVWKK